MRTMTVNETREVCGGWSVKCPICNKKVKVSFWSWLFSASVKTDLSNYHWMKKGGKRH